MQSPFPLHFRIIDTEQEKNSLDMESVRYWIQFQNKYTMNCINSYQFQLIPKVPCPEQNIEEFEKFITFWEVYMYHLHIIDTWEYSLILFSVITIFNYIWSSSLNEINSDHCPSLIIDFMIGCKEYLIVLFPFNYVPNSPSHSLLSSLHFLI